MDETNEGSSQKLWAGLAFLILTAVIVGTVVVSRPKSILASGANATASVSQSAPSQTPATTTKSASAQSGTYKDGTYSATGHYDSPGGTEAVKVSLTLVGDKVSAATVSSGANDPTALSYQTIFISGYKPFVVGKKINTIKLSNVSGSSLTSQGFNDALKQIERQAQA